MKDIGKLLKYLKGSNVPDKNFKKKELEMGIKDEMEHTDSKLISKAITKGHLIKNPNYYTEMYDMESKFSK